MAENFHEPELLDVTRTVTLKLLSKTSTLLATNTKAIFQVDTF